MYDLPLLLVVQPAVVDSGFVQEVWVGGGTQERSGQLLGHGSTRDLVDDRQVFVDVGVHQEVLQLRK